MDTTATRQPKPGYVYALVNPALPGLVKVGHTYRPPHKRADELSRTALPLPFEIDYARFFWNAPVAEKTIHQHFAAWRPSRKREFFRLPAEQIIQVIGSLDHRMGLPRTAGSDHDIEAPWTWRVAEPDWEVSLEGLEEQWGWAEEEIASNDPILTRQGWARMESLSAAGWAEGTWRLAEALMRKDPGVCMARRAVWVLEAAAAQGHPGASLRAAWLRSFWGEDEFQAWKNEMACTQARLGGRDALSWPDSVRQTLQAEMSLWGQYPERRLDSSLFHDLKTTFNP